MSAARRSSRQESSVPQSNTPPTRTRRTPAVSEPVAGYRASKRSSKLGRQLRREAKSERVKQQVNAGVRTAGNSALGLMQIIGLTLAGIAAGGLLLFGVVNGINALARWRAQREAKEAASPEARSEIARENLLIIGATGTSSAEFLAVRLDEEGKQVLGIAIPSGAFMEVPGQGFERVGDSYPAGVGVSLAAVSNYLSVPFEHYVVVDVTVYQDALTNQSLRDVMPNVKSSDLSAEEQARVAEFIEGVSADRTALVPLPVKPIDLGGQTFFEPQRDKIADLLLEWWDVRLGAEDETVRCIIYNGSGTPGIAGEAAQQLISAGLRVVDTQNADRFDYQTTLIVVQDGDLTQGDLVKSALGVGEIIDQPSEQDVADVIIIIGRDFVPRAQGGQS